MLAVLVLQRGKDLPLALTQRRCVWEFAPLGLASSFNIFLFINCVTPNGFNYKIISSGENTVSCQHMTKLKSGPKLGLTQVRE